MDLIKFIINYLKEGHPMEKQYCRHKENKFRYYQFSIMVDDHEGPFPETTVMLREIGIKEPFEISLEAFNEYYVACSPWEAIGSRMI